MVGVFFFAISLKFGGRGEGKMEEGLIFAITFY